MAKCLDSFKRGFTSLVYELISRHPVNRVLPIKEPIEAGLPTDFVNGRNVILLYKMNLLRCELELRDNKLSYTKVSQIIKAIQNNTFQDTVEKCYSSILSGTVFATPAKSTSKTSLKEIAIILQEMLNEITKRYSQILAWLENTIISRKPRKLLQEKMT